MGDGRGRRAGGLLAARGWVPEDEPHFSHFYRRLDTPIDDVPALPDGYRLVMSGCPEDAAARVEVHRAAFAPSRMTLEKYATLAGMPRYAEEGDLVVEAPDGSLAAFVMVWWSRDAGVGEFEPVGTHPDHQRRGLGRAVNLAGLHRLRDLGASTPSCSRARPTRRQRLSTDPLGSRPSRTTGRGPVRSAEDLARERDRAAGEPA